MPDDKSEELDQEDMHDTLPTPDRRAAPDDYSFMWKTLAGDHYEKMLSSVNTAIEHLKHDSWKIRLTAISILWKHWEATDELLAIMPKMTFEDPHPQVRAVAMFTLACCYSGTNNWEILKWLASAVCNGDLDERSRRSAYDGLFQVMGTLGRARPLPGNYRFPEDVDWELVKSLGKDKT